MKTGQIEHVVVLMLENRSFDHLLGLLDHPALPTVLDEPLENPLEPTKPGSPRYSAYELDGYDALSADPKHGFPDVMRQLSGHAGPWRSPYTLTNNGFAWNFHARRGASGAQVLGCYPPKLVPVLSTLARDYGVCTRWFCSVPSETWPNRLFAHAATSDDLLINKKDLYDDRTVFEALSSAKKSWQIYAGDIPQCSVFSELWWHDGGPRFSRLSAFFEHAQAGRLPNYSFLEPRHFGSAMDSQHPLGKVLLGERLIASVYQAITSNREGWNKTVLVITYDEHGGFFDRVPPAAAVPHRAGAKDPNYGFTFDLLGPRVPAVVVSPWIDALAVHDSVHDHTSIIATLRELFGFDETLTDRDAAARGFAALLTRAKPRDPIQLPQLPTIRAAELGPAEWAEGVAPDGTIQLNDLQQQLVDLALRIEDAQPPPKGPRGVELEPAPEPPFSSEAEVGEFVEAFRRRQLERM
jgi:phospholipase C